MKTTVSTFRYFIISAFILCFCLIACSDDDAPPLLKDKIVFISDRGGTFLLYTMNINGSSADDVVEGAAPDVSPNGKSIAYTKGNNIYIIDADGSNAAQLTITDKDYQPRWSPNGSKLVFYSFRDGGSAQLYTVKKDGTGVTPITSETDKGFIDAKWSPDGSKILCNGGGAVLNREIYVVGADGTGLTPLTNNEFDDFNASWSPDGSKIIFSSNRDGDYEIYTMSANGTNVERLTTRPGTDTKPSWSPDGTEILFHSDDKYAVYKMNADGTGVTQLSFPASDDYDESPAWSADGSKIIFTRSIKLATPGYQSDIFSVNRDGTMLVNLTSNPAADFSPAWSPR